MQEQSTALFFQQAGSDKTYQIQLVSNGDDWRVNFQYGRRGGPLKAGSKTPTGVPYPAARAIYDALLREKQSKGYTPSESGVAFVDTALSGQVSGVLPQLSNPIDEGDLHHYLDDANWLMMIKADGERRLILKSGEKIRGINRKGLFVALSAPVVEAIRALPYDHLLIDGEDLGDAGYKAFDLLERQNIDLRGCDAVQRHSALVSVLSALPDSSVVSLIPWIVGKDKRAALDRLRESGEEGVIFKLANSGYQPSRPARDGSSMKWKFTDSATVLCESVTAGKRSVSMRVFDGDTPHDIGRCTIPPNVDMIRPGDIFECTYLYGFRNGCLFQPVWKALRPDQDVSDCTVAQIKFKAVLDEAA